MMPDTDPVIDNVALVEFVLRTAKDTACVNVFPAAAITKGLGGREMTEFGLLREAGAVAFTDGRHTIASSLVMRRALTYARDFGAMIVHETQDADLASSGVMNEGLYASWLGLSGIPREAEIIPLERDLALARLTGGAYHAAKISTALATNALGRAKADGANVTAGVSIHNLSLNENDVGEYRTFFRLTPPLRAEDDRLAMIEAVRDGTIDVVVSSHDPQDVDTKRLPFADAAAGAIGLETLLGAALRLYHNGDVPLLRLIEVLSTAPARLFGLPGGTLKPGAAADLAVVDLDEPWLVSEAASARAPRTPVSRARGCRARSCKHGWRAAKCFRPRPAAEPARQGEAMTYVPVIALAFGYLLGSIPFGLLITRAAGLGDVRNIGSGNIGATNVLRTGNKGLAAATLLLDALKGTAAVLIAARYGPELGAWAGLRRLSRPSVPGLARLQGRQGRRHLSRRADRARLAGRADLRRRLAGGGLRLPLLVAGSPHRRRRRARGTLVPGSAAGGRPVRGHERHRLHQAPRQHPRLLAGTEGRIGAKG